MVQGMALQSSVILTGLKKQRKGKNEELSSQGIDKA